MKPYSILKITGWLVCLLAGSMIVVVTQSESAEAQDTRERQFRTGMQVPPIHIQLINRDDFKYKPIEELPDYRQTVTLEYKITIKSIQRMMSDTVRIGFYSELERRGWEVLSGPEDIELIRGRDWDWDTPNKDSYYEFDLIYVVRPREPVYINEQNGVASIHVPQSTRGGYRYKPKGFESWERDPSVPEILTPSRSPVNSENEDSSEALL